MSAPVNVTAICPACRKAFQTGHPVEPCYYCPRCYSIAPVMAQEVHRLYREVERLRDGIVLHEEMRDAELAGVTTADLTLWGLLDPTPPSEGPKEGAL